MRGRGKFPEHTVLESARTSNELVNNDETTITGLIRKLGESFLAEFLLPASDPASKNMLLIA